MHLVRQSARAGEQANVRAMRAETERKRKKRAEDAGGAASVQGLRRAAAGRRGEDTNV